MSHFKKNAGVCQENKQMPMEPFTVNVSRVIFPPFPLSVANNRSFFENVFTIKYTNKPLRTKPLLHDKKM